MGGLAVQFYVPDRQVDDLDILIDPSQETAAKVIAALSSPLFHHSITVEQLTQLKRIQVPVKIDFYLDILTPGPEIDFAQEWTLAREAKLGATPVRVAAIETLLKLLSGSQEPKHIRDIELLKRVKAGTPQVPL
ncbi:MAG TPA: hypothetical protein VIW72_07740 [Burkholderiales bacterium]